MSNSQVKHRVRIKESDYKVPHAMTTKSFLCQKNVIPILWLFCSKDDWSSLPELTKLRLFESSGATIEVCVDSTVLYERSMTAHSKSPKPG